MPAGLDERLELLHWLARSSVSTKWHRILHELDDYFHILYYVEYGNVSCAQGQPERTVFIRQVVHPPAYYCR